MATAAPSDVHRWGPSRPASPAGHGALGGARAQATLLNSALLLVFTYVFLANAWLGDDAYITFRVIDNFIGGHGLTFNPDERVQAYTHPLWTLLLSAAYAVTSDLFFTTLAISYALCVLAVITVFRYLRSAWRGALFVGLLLTSKAFIDYTSSGLEYPLSFLLLAVFYCRFFTVTRDAVPPAPRDLMELGLVASLAFLNRSDSILLYVGPLTYLAYVSWRKYRARLLLFFSIALAPAAIWLLFSLIYYGFPFPNTYYAQIATGIPRSVQLRQGLAYALNSINFDPLTLGLIALASAAAARTRRLPNIAAAASALLYVLYTVSVGGDFMSGRFFAMPLFIAAILLVWSIERREVALAVGAGLVAYTIVAPLAPVKTQATYDGAWSRRLQNGIRDERGYYHQITNVLFYAPFRTMPDHVWFREGIGFRSSAEKVAVPDGIGFFGFNAGPGKHVIDRNALSDPLLARLPVSESLYFDFYAGRFFRELPDGYLESRREGRNLIVDPVIHDYYDKVLNVTAGPIFTRTRARDIWDLNVGRYRRIDDVVAQRRPVAVSVPADNMRFSTDIGIRDARGTGVLRTSGRPGYLQMGPNIPLKAGQFRVRWIGTTSATPGQPLGFVDVWIDGERRINRQPVIAGELSSEKNVLAEISFVLKRPTTNLEYRFYVERDVQMVLERVNLDSISLSASPQTAR